MNLNKLKSVIIKTKYVQFIKYYFGRSGFIAVLEVASV